MTILPRFLLDEDDDYHETYRSRLYPKLHPVLKLFGGYGVGTVGADQYVGTTRLDEETLEEELVDLGFVRNPVSCFKTGPDGRPSTGSWALLAADSDRVDRGMQLHVTLFNKRSDGVDIYAHYEDDWRRRPLSHLRENRFQPVYGADLARTLLDERSYIDLRY